MVNREEGKKIRAANVRMMDFIEKLPRRLRGR